MVRSDFCGFEAVLLNLKENLQEHLEERAAIMEFDGGLFRDEAQKAAKANVRVYLYRISDKPDNWLTMISPGAELGEAKEHMCRKFGPDRLLEVKEYEYKDV